jgi:molybdate transport system ATP-binding protein
MSLRCIAGVETPDEGLIILNNRVLFDSKNRINLLPKYRKVGLLFQNYALFPNMTLQENIAMGIPKNRKDKIDNTKVIKEKIKAFSLEGLENNYPHQLSGGQQQRVALARMLVNEPEILMLDEPFSALDEHLRWQMEQKLIGLLKDHKGSALYVSHNKDEVYRICDRIAVINNGKIEEIKEKEELFNYPTTINTATLTGCKNISNIKKIDDNKIFSYDWNLELSCNKKIENDIQYVGIHTHHLRICSSIEEDNTFELKIVERIENIFSYILVLSNIETNNNSLNSNPYLYMETSLEAFNNLKSKETVYVKLDKDKLLLLK